MANTNPKKKGSVPAATKKNNGKPTVASNAKLIKDYYAALDAKGDALAAEAKEARERQFAATIAGQREIGDAIAETNENIAMVEENSQARHEESLRVGRQRHEESLQAIREVSEKFDAVASYEEPLSKGAKVVILLFAVIAAIVVWVITAVAGWAAWTIALAVIGTFAVVVGLSYLMAAFFS